MASSSNNGLVNEDRLTALRLHRHIRRQPARPFDGATG